MFTIYRHVHSDSGKCYVGQTGKTMLERWRGHMRDARKGSPRPFHCAIRKYGVEAFAHEILEEVATLEEANAAEVKWIAHFGSNGDSRYNLDAGGTCHGTHPATREKRRAGWAALDKEQRSARACGTSTPEERSERARIAQTKLTPEQVGRKRLAIGRVRAGMTPEQRKNRVRNAASGVEPEARAAAGRVRWARVTPEQRRENMVPAIAAAAARPPEARSATAKARQAAKTPEQRSAEVKLGRARMGTEACRAAGQKGNATRPDSIRKALAAKTPEERSEMGRRSWESRRANAAAREKVAA